MWLASCSLPTMVLGYLISDVKSGPACPLVYECKLWPKNAWVRGGTPFPKTERSKGFGQGLTLTAGGGDENCLVEKYMN